MSKLSHLTRTAILLACFFALDKVLAFSKSMLFNKIVGLEGMGIFGAANNIPDTLSALLSGGALGMAFIPVLTEYLDNRGRGEAWALFSRIVNLSFTVTGVVSILIALFSRPLVQLIIAPGFSLEKQVTVISLMRLDLFAILLFSISGLVMSGLQANKHFFLPALAPIFYNLGQIFGVTILSPEIGLKLGPIQLPGFGMGLYGMVYGVIIGAILHLLIQVPGLVHYQFHWSMGFDLKNSGVQKVLVLLGPRILTMACIQVYFIARDNLSSWFGTTGVGAMNLGWTIEQVPETIIGTAIAVALLPSLAEYINFGKRDEFTNTINRALRVMLAFSLTAAALLSVSVRPLAGAFFGYDANRLDLLTGCSIIFLFGLLGDVWLEVAVRSFYAKQNTKTPLVAALAQIIAFVLLSITLKSMIGLFAIPLAAAITFTTQAFVLLFIMQKEHRGLLKFNGTFPRAVLAALLAGSIAWLGFRYLPFSEVVSTLIGMIVGGLTAALIIWPEIRRLFTL